MRNPTPGPYMYVPCLPRLVWSGFDGTTAPNKLLHNMNIIAGEKRLCSTYYYLVSLEINGVGYPCLNCANYGVQLCGVYLGANINHKPQPQPTPIQHALIFCYFLPELAIMDKKNLSFSSLHVGQKFVIVCTRFRSPLGRWSISQVPAL